MRLVALLTATSVYLISAAGCTSHSWTQIERVYVASYGEVFEKLPVEAKKCMMSLKKSEPEAGLIVLTARRFHDQILTGSLFNWIGGDEVIVKVQRVGPTTSKIHIDSKARGQIGPDLFRTDRNVTSLASVLDQVWVQVEAGTEERGEKRPGSATADPKVVRKDDGPRGNASLPPSARDEP